jgi:hypothetical protein
MQSKAKTVAAYLKELPPDRREAVEAVRRVILDNVDENIEEGMTYGMIGYYIPHRVFPRGYHCDPSQPVTFAGIASQKNHMSVYLMPVYGDSNSEKRLREGFERAGKKLDMGKSCVRFRKVEDLSLETIGDVLRRTSVSKFLEMYVATVGEDAWKGSKAKKPAGATGTTSAKNASGAAKTARKGSATKAR